MCNLSAIVTAVAVWVFKGGIEKGSFAVMNVLVGDEAALDRGGFDRLLQFLEGAHLDLANALARDAVLLREILERGRVLPQAPLGQDVALAVVQMRHRLFEQVTAQSELLPLAEARKGEARDARTLHRHSRESGNPGSKAAKAALAPRFRGGDG
jgi:hypothetical protein